MRSSILLIAAFFYLFSPQCAGASGGATCSDWISGSGVTVESYGAYDTNDSLFGSSIKLGFTTDKGVTTITRACRDAIFKKRTILGFPTYIHPSEISAFRR